MIAQGTLALIAYNDSNKVLQDRDYALANRLAAYLRSKGIEAEIKGYSSINSPNVLTHQWLILIPSLGIEASPQITKIVDDALDQVVKRRMQGILAITASAYDVPPTWATIRKYDASDPGEENNALADIWRAMNYTKVTYPEGMALHQSQQEQQAAARQQKTPSGWFRFVLVAAILVLLVAASGVAWFSIKPFSVSTLSLSNLTATAQVRKNATQIALLQTAQTSPTVVSQTFRAARQKEYDDITQKTTTIVGFRANLHWSTASTGTTSCEFEGNNPSAYDAIIQTPNEYTSCMETKTQFTNFAMQVTMNIQGDAGGVIFRDNGNGTYYRFAFNQGNPSKPTYSVYLCNGDCSTNAVGSGKQLVYNMIKVDLTKPITLTIVAQSSNIDLYINKKFQARVTDMQSLSGQIGVFAASLGSPYTDVTFSDLKVWSLVQSQPKPHF